MAFRFVVETGQGLRDATSYASVEEADDWNDNRPHGQSWATLEELPKQQALVWATTLLDDLISWYGNTTYVLEAAQVNNVNQVQRLQWPRYGVEGKSGYILDQNRIPDFLKNATAEYARILAAKDRTVEPQTQGFSQLKVGPVSLNIDKYNQLEPLPRSVRILVAGYGRTSDSPAITR